MEPMQYVLSGRGPVVVAVFTFFMVLTTITTALRVYVRTSIVKMFGYDDWTSIAGWILFLVYDALIIAGCYYGLGQYTDRIPETVLPTALKVGSSFTSGAEY